ncbi:hypothetical protein [Microbacterium hydrocarbonoxydans]|jgi:hypothetical protein|uniref:Uncharacterized protein n=1 Tax=Microbacterium hydrocarbonoxydans TaxID=273678 RepID=A0A1H4J589_9MICO|nr:hypothetical protein [Microbacterium hydrocarbonoxydans]SEB41367.1 hypothetical protein SAMN04489807_0581 [Microbacterium hydrocarbonoxydans]
MMTRKAAYLIAAGAGLLVAVSVAVYIFTLGVLADSSTESVVLPIWAVVLGVAAVIVFLVFLIKWGLLRTRS